MPPSGPSGFEIDPFLLRGLGDSFALEARRLGTGVLAFERQATHVEQAFGLLGPSDELYFEYLELARSTVRGLRGLEEALEGLGRGLHVTAQSYEDAELASSAPTSSGL